MPCPLHCNVKGRPQGRNARDCPKTCSQPATAENDEGWYRLSVPFLPPSHRARPAHLPPKELPQAHLTRGLPLSLGPLCRAHGLGQTQCDSLGAALKIIEGCVPTCLGLSYIGGPRHALDFRHLTGDATLSDISTGDKGAQGSRQWCAIAGVPLAVDPPNEACVEKGSDRDSRQPPQYAMEINIDPALALPDESENRAIAGVWSDSAASSSIAGGFCRERGIEKSHTDFCRHCVYTFNQLYPNLIYISIPFRRVESHPDDALSIQ